MCWPAVNYKAGPVGYDPELEREKLAFEKAKWETEQRWWEAEMETKKAEAEEGKRKEQMEFEEKNARRQWSLKNVNAEKH